MGREERRILVLASGNAGKLRELGALLRREGFDLRPQSEWGIPEASEDGLSFIENALLKARHAASRCGHPAVADDSGLVVPALGGQPGIYSARYAGPNSSDADNNAKLLHAMDALEGDQRRAYFYCAMALARDGADPIPLVATASWPGSILREARGDGGFGYDPLFLVEKHGCSSAELPAATKNRVSHR
ncbi:MAG: RdgB/HAM1 family non-canonical purine NTP pyrophosphatase, partial [Gammaproteobacteria bacterium]|nr:RdgB/HAM1 family non-canonical purine NTP pyrophosphatase [Gammaproteobacteria bacterium]